MQREARMKTTLGWPSFAVAVALVTCSAAPPAEARTVQEFIADCPNAEAATDEACSITLVKAQTNAREDDLAGMCDFDKPEVVLPRVVEWLTLHSMAHPDDADAAVTEALKSLYCT